ncbi:MAG: DegT/DnrJ/EryC1/StrS family aminotransferase [Phycisphaerales bacterium JB063]
MSEIPLSRPDITDAEITAVSDVLRSGRLSIGPQQELFEQRVARRCERREGVAVSSGTAGLHLVLAALGVGPGDEVLTTPFSFIASANCILMVGATPKFVDICPQSLNMDPAKLDAAITPQTKAIIAVEVFGQARHMDAIEAVARKHEVPLIEDACEGLGGRLGDRAVGGFGRASVFGFYPNKQITTGEGGMIVTDDDRLADLCRSLRNQGRAQMNATLAPPEDVDPKSAPDTGAWLDHPRLGYNYRLSEIAAALGVVQMDRLDEMLDARRRVAERYTEMLLDQPDLVLPAATPGEESKLSWFVYVVRLGTQYNRAARDRVIEGMRRHEIGAANYFPCIHLQPFYRERFGFKPGDFPIAESISDRTLALPFYNHLSDEQADLVCQTLALMLQRERMLLDD